MTDLSISQSYFLFAASKEGKLYGREGIRVACLMAAALSELEEQGILSIHRQSVTLTGKELEETSPLKTFYDYLKQQAASDPVKQHQGLAVEISLKEIQQTYSSSWSDRHLNALTNRIGTVLSDRRIVTKAKMGMFNGRTYFMPHKNTFPSILAELEVSLSYQVPSPADDGFLWLLLEKSGLIPKDFSEAQIKDFSGKINTTITEDPDGTLARRAALLKQLLSLAKTNTVFT